MNRFLFYYRQTDRGSNVAPASWIPGIPWVPGGGGIMVWGRFFSTPINYYHSLLEYCCWSRAFLHDHTSPYSEGFFQNDNVACHKAKAVSDWVHKHDRESNALQWPLLSPDRNLVVEQEIDIMKVHLGIRNCVGFSHVNMDLNLRGMFPSSCGNSALAENGENRGSTQYYCSAPNVLWILFGFCLPSLPNVGGLQVKKCLVQAFKW